MLREGDPLRSHVRTPREEMVDSLVFGEVSCVVSNTDGQLMGRLRAQDEPALGVLYDRHAVVAFGLALRMPRDPTSAEEASQEALVLLWRRASADARDRASVRTWLLTMVRSPDIDRLRRVSAKEQVPGLDQGEELVAVSDSWRLAIEGLLAKGVRGALADLPPEQRQILEWVYCGGLSQSGNAERIGMAFGTVKSRTRLALERLRRLLAESVAAEVPASSVIRRDQKLPSSVAMKPSLAQLPLDLPGQQRSLSARPRLLPDLLRSGDRGLQCGP